MTLSTGGSSFLYYLCLIVCLVSSTNGSESNNFISFDHYHHQEEMQDLFNQLAIDFPYYARVGSIGKSVKNRDLIYLEISDNVQIESPSRPKVKYVGNMHGDETVGRELIIFLSQYLLYNHANNSQAHSILQSMRLFLMPTLNPDGFEMSKEGLCRGGHRSNFHNKDLNRNFPDQFALPYVLEHLNPEKETKAMMNWITSNK